MGRVMRRAEHRCFAEDPPGLQGAKARSPGARSLAWSRLNCWWCSGCSLWW
jgi:hypothetical protein